MLTHWTRDRSRGPKLPLELIVHRQTAQTAALYGLRDRGLIAPGMRADLNLIDYDHLSFDISRMA
jgi:N-acyl-D-amino-acid deacylase